LNGDHAQQPQRLLPRVDKGMRFVRKHQHGVPFLEGIYRPVASAQFSFSAEDEDFVLPRVFMEGGVSPRSDFEKAHGKGRRAVAVGDELFDTCPLPPSAVTG